MVCNRTDGTEVVGPKINSGTKGLKTAFFQEKKKKKKKIKKTIKKIIVSRLATGRRVSSSDRAVDTGGRGRPGVDRTSTPVTSAG